MFGSVFGRSKKSASNINSPANSSQQRTGNEINQTTLNYYPTILTDEVSSIYYYYQVM